MLMQDKVAIVTGGASGIGRACAVLLAQHGAKVLVADIDTAGGDETVSLISQSGGEAAFQRTDVVSDADNAAMVAAAISRWGKLDVAVNNAGMTGSFSSVEQTSESDWDRVMAVNAKSVFLAMKHEIPAMRKAGGGSIVNTSSGSTRRTQVNMIAYVASKHAVNGLTIATAADVGADNIRVNAILPGTTWTPMMERGMQGHDIPEEGWKKLSPMGRMGQASEQAGAVLWLCSPLSSYVTGQLVCADGGATI